MHGAICMVPYARCHMHGAICMVPYAWCHMHGAICIDLTLTWQLHIDLTNALIQVSGTCQVNVNVYGTSLELTFTVCVSVCACQVNVNVYGTSQVR